RTGVLLPRPCGPAAGPAAPATGGSANAPAERAIASSTGTRAPRKPRSVTAAGGGSAVLLIWTAPMPSSRAATRRGPGTARTRARATMAAAPAHRHPQPDGGAMGGGAEREGAEGAPAGHRPSPPRWWGVGRRGRWAAADPEAGDRGGGRVG